MLVVNQGQKERAEEYLADTSGPHDNHLGLLLLRDSHDSFSWIFHGFTSHFVLQLRVRRHVFEKYTETFGSTGSTSGVVTKLESYLHLYARLLVVFFKFARFCIHVVHDLLPVRDRRSHGCCRRESGSKLKGFVLVVCVCTYMFPVTIQERFPVFTAPPSASFTAVTKSCECLEQITSEYLMGGVYRSTLGTTKGQFPSADCFTVSRRSFAIWSPLLFPGLDQPLVLGHVC